MAFSLEQEAPTAPEQDILPSVLASGRILVDHLNSTMEVDGRNVGLELTELKVLELLIINRGRIVTREKMSRAIWNGYAGEKTGDLYISCLRRKMGVELRGAIKTKFKFGYIIDDNTDFRLSANGSQERLTQDYYSDDL